MQIRNQKDFWAGVMFIGFGLATLAIAIGPPAFLVSIAKDWFNYKLEYGYQMGTAVRMGPAYFPTVLGGLLAVLGSVVLVRGFASHLPESQTKVIMSFGLLELLIGIAIFAALGLISKELWKNADYGMLAASVLLAGLAFKYRPDTKPMVLIAACCLVFAYLLKPLGLVAASVLMVFIAALGGHEFKLKEVTILAVVLAIFSVGVFVYGLTLPFPIWPDFLQ
jgi:putative tricarboxylic transport membrane protein